MAERVVGSLARGGDLVLVHWTGETDYPLSGDEASEQLLEKMRPALRDDTPEAFRALSP